MLVFESVVAVSLSALDLAPLSALLLAFDFPGRPCFFLYAAFFCRLWSSGLILVTDVETGTVLLLLLLLDEKDVRYKYNSKYRKRTAKKRSKIRSVHSPDPIRNEGKRERSDNSHSASYPVAGGARPKVCHFAVFILSNDKNHLGSTHREGK